MNLIRFQISVQYKSGATTKGTKDEKSVMYIIFLSNVISVSENVL